MADDPVAISLPEAGPELDVLLDALPDVPAVFLLTSSSGQPYLSKTAVLGRRVRRLLQANDRRRAALNLRGLVNRLAYWPMASRLESAILFYRLARQHFPDSYLKLCNLRMPSYVRVLLRNDFPRTQVSTRLTNGGVAYGPFRSRSSAEAFEKATLDLFQVRRCQDDLQPSAAHPGCMYGEMSQCLRPCQEVVGREEYRSEVNRFVEFLTTEGRSLTETVERMRDQFSAEMEFEEAARQHRRLEKIDNVWRLRDELATDAGNRYGVAVLRSLEPGTVTLLFLWQGCWLAPALFPLQPIDGKPISLDRRLREVVQSVTAPHLVTQTERGEHLALLARWFYSSWRDGEWLPFSTPENIGYRKFVNMVHRIAEM